MESPASQRKEFSIASLNDLPTSLKAQSPSPKASRIACIAVPHRPQSPGARLCSQGRERRAVASQEVDADGRASSCQLCILSWTCLELATACVIEWSRRLRIVIHC